MDAVVYPREEQIDVIKEGIQRGAISVKCEACEGTGEFTITDGDSQQCVPCKGHRRGSCWDLKRKYFILPNSSVVYVV